MHVSSYISAHSASNSFSRNLSLILSNIPGPIGSYKYQTHHRDSKNHGLVNKSRSYVLWEGLCESLPIPFVFMWRVDWRTLAKELTTLSSTSYSHLITTKNGTLDKRWRRHRIRRRRKRKVNDMFSCRSRGLLVFYSRVGSVERVLWRCLVYVSGIA